MKDIQSLSHTLWDCKYHIVWIPKCRRKVLYGQLRKHLDGPRTFNRFERFTVFKPPAFNGCNRFCIKIEPKKDL